MDLRTAITAEVEGITGLMDSIIEKVQSLKAQGIYVTQREDFKSKVRTLNLVIAGTPSDGVADAEEKVSRKRMTEGETKTVDDIAVNLIRAADQKTGIHISVLRQQFEDDPTIKANNWGNKLQAKKADIIFVNSFWVKKYVKRCYLF
jgi:hypothetical protein